MDWHWRMYGDQCTMGWINGLKTFVDAGPTLSHIYAGNVQIKVMMTIKGQRKGLREDVRKSIRSIECGHPGIPSIIICGHLTVELLIVDISNIMYSNLLNLIIQLRADVNIN